MLSGRNNVIFDQASSDVGSPMSVSLVRNSVNSKSRIEMNAIL